MIECYYQWCKHHPKDEPFCCEEKCLATDDELKEFAVLRYKEMKSWDDVYTEHDWNYSEYEYGKLK